MSINKKLSEWRQQEVIDANTAAAIARYEAAQDHITDHLWRYGLFGLAVLCIALGIGFIVAANWQLIPFSVKLVNHAVINLALGGFLLHTVLRRPERKKTGEALLLILAAAQLTLMALIGQYLQISALFDDVMLAWWCLIAPMLALLGRTGLSGLLFFGLGFYVFFSQLNIDEDYLFLLIFSGLTALYLIGHDPRLNALRPAWMKMLRQASFLLIFAFAAASTTFDVKSIPHHHPWIVTANTIGALALAAVMGFAVLRRQPLLHLQRSVESEVVAFSLASAGLAQILFIHGADIVLFCTFFLAVGWIGYRFRQRQWISLSILAVALRLAVYFIDLTQHLLLNGLMMIGIGVLTLLALRRLVWKGSVS